MKILGFKMAQDFAARYPQSKGPLEKWRRTVSQLVWTNSAELKNSFRNANYVQNKKCLVFDVSRNRLIGKVDFTNQIVLIIDVLTHREYDRWSKNP